jgi:hypothetical protein
MPADAKNYPGLTGVPVPCTKKQDSYNLEKELHHGGG